MSLPTFTSDTIADDVSTVFANEMKGKNGTVSPIFDCHILIYSTVLITGTSINGIGFEAARVIAKHANLVIITGYNAERWGNTVCFASGNVKSSNAG